MNGPRVNKNFICLFVYGLGFEGRNSVYSLFLRYDSCFYLFYFSMKFMFLFHFVFFSNQTKNDVKLTMRIKQYK